MWQSPPLSTSQQRSLLFSARFTHHGTKFGVLLHVNVSRAIGQKPQCRIRSQALQNNVNMFIRAAMKKNFAHLNGIIAHSIVHDGQSVQVKGFRLALPLCCSTRAYGALAFN